MRQLGGADARRADGRRVAATETNLEYPGNLFGVGAVHVCLSDGPHVEEFAAPGGNKIIFIIYNYNNN